MTKAALAKLVKDTYEAWHGRDSWGQATNWRKSDWRKLVTGIIMEATKPEHHSRPLLPSEIPVPPQPFKPRPARPLRADATDPNPED